ncbi:MAG TPA: diguanylate cyclase [Acidimicrobiia bacterium]|nr:diguanylate cyclase [Acidimicrobiia bacterium]
MVADDDATSRRITSTVVERLGHECLTATDGEEAWRILEGRVVDVLLTDWMMPRLDGPELCKRVRSRIGAHYTYIIMVTSLSDRDDVVAGMEAGADDYLAKPLDPFDVRTRLIAATRVTGLHHQLHDVRQQLEHLNAKLAVQARTDPLTDLGNRLRLHEDLVTTRNRARRSAVPYAVAICDLDLFKRYNDRFGHLAGDDALRAVASTIAAQCRASDRAYRYGGEEFLVLYDDTLTGAEDAAERLRVAVEGLGLSHPDNAPRGVVTLSIGVAASDGAADADAVLRVADDALYRAKSQGRNRVVGAGGVPAEAEAWALSPPG